MNSVSTQWQQVLHTNNLMYFDLILKIAQSKLLIARSLSLTKLRRFCFFQLKKSRIRGYKLEIKNLVGATTINLK